MRDPIGPSNSSRQQCREPQHLMCSQQHRAIQWRFLVEHVEASHQPFHLRMEWLLPHGVSVRQLHAVGSTVHALHSRLQLSQESSNATFLRKWKHSTVYHHDGVQLIVRRGPLSNATGTTTARHVTFPVVLPREGRATVRALEPCPRWWWWWLDGADFRLQERTRVLVM